MNELDCERERRWKSEQATRKLLDTIKALQERCAFFLSRYFLYL